ncbi:MAG: sulfatase-like hydrolase/transferase [Chloroflexota bacterium]
MDGYDVGIRYVDDHVGQVLATLDDLGVLDETAIIFSADHGENQGELNVYGDHQTADRCTSNVPLIVRWPGVTQLDGVSTPWCTSRTCRRRCASCSARPCRNAEMG